MIGAGRRTFVTIVVATVAVCVVVGLFLLGPPGRERERRLDARRVADLRELAMAVDLFWSRQARLPAALSDLSHEAELQINPADPVTGMPYSYRVTGEKSYELCAQFGGPSGEDRGVPRVEFWAHGAGSQCFRLEAKDVQR